MGGGKTRLIEDAHTLQTSLRSLEDLTRAEVVVMKPNPDSASQTFALQVLRVLEKVLAGVTDPGWVGTESRGYDDAAAG